MRRHDWPERLSACVEAAREQPFAWGSNDCVLWACMVIEQMTGVDVTQDFRGSYQSASGALRTLRSLCGGAESLEEAVTALAEQYGFPFIAPALARRGDAVLLPSGMPSWPHTLGICLGKEAAATGEKGLMRLPMEKVLAAWRVS